MLLFLTALYVILVSFILYRIVQTFKVKNRMAENVFLIVSSCLVAFVIGIFRTDLQSIFMIISLLLLVAYFIVAARRL